MGPLLAMGLLHLLSCATATAIPPTDNFEADIFEADQAPLEHSTERKTMFATTKAGEVDDDAEARGIGWQPGYMTLEGDTYADCQGIYSRTTWVHDNHYMWERVQPDNKRWLFWAKSSGTWVCTSSGTHWNNVYSGASDGGFIFSAPAGGCCQTSYSNNKCYSWDYANGVCTTLTSKSIGCNRGVWMSHKTYFYQSGTCDVPAAYSVDWSAAGAKAKKLPESGYVLINDYACHVSSVTLIDTDSTGDCDKGYPHYDPEGMACGYYNNGYCSYALGEHVCAYCDGIVTVKG